MERKTGFADRFFGISQSHSSVKTEVLAGITTFITIAYILILNPQILSDPYLIMGDAAMAQKIANGVLSVPVSERLSVRSFVHCMQGFRLLRRRAWD